MEPLQPLDRLIFSERGSDQPLNATDQIYRRFADELEAFDYFDRAALMALEVKVAMLWRLSSYFKNVVTTKKDAGRWKLKALAFRCRNPAARRRRRSRRLAGGDHSQLRPVDRCLVARRVGAYPIGPKRPIGPIGPMI